ncbi:hypothetical protein HMPREF9554_03186 [Treponema phagedenis F0421]|nr:hypothetical protein HMPREF9554_03186 [Treponema phagedenis F0421]
MKNNQQASAKTYLCNKSCVRIQKAKPDPFCVPKTVKSVAATAESMT